MGCDIHLHTEIKLNGKWEHYSTPDVPRNYGLFGKMAGVRGGAEPISRPRGIPKDSTTVTKFDNEHWCNDGHSHSWLNAAEILELQEFMEERLGNDKWRLEMDYWGYLFGNSWGGFSKYPEDCQKGVEDVRFVFWFDN